jgi:YebC/PmpR family DNA-binding regulatory protein
MGRGPNIEGRKNAEDSKRAKLFTKLIREITVAARAGGDPAGNPRLRLAVDKALASNMSKDTMVRAIRRGTGEDGADQVQEVRYEGYGPGGVAIMVDCMTDNPTRTVADVRHAFVKHGGNLGTSGSVAFQFSRTGRLLLDTGGNPQLEEKILEVALESGADDVRSEKQSCEVLTSAERFEAVKKALAAAGLALLEADIVMHPSVRVTVAGDAAESLARLLEHLEELDDVQEIYHNADLPAAALA